MAGGEAEPATSHLRDRELLVPTIDIPPDLHLRAVGGAQACDIPCLGLVGPRNHAVVATAGGDQSEPLGDGVVPGVLLESGSVRGGAASDVEDKGAALRDDLEPLVGVDACGTWLGDRVVGSSVDVHVGNPVTICVLVPETVVSAGYPWAVVALDGLAIRIAIQADLTPRRVGAFLEEVRKVGPRHPLCRGHNKGGRRHGGC